MELRVFVFYSNLERRVYAHYIMYTDEQSKTSSLENKYINTAAVEKCMRI